MWYGGLVSKDEYSTADLLGQECIQVELLCGLLLHPESTLM